MNEWMNELDTLWFSISQKFWKKKNHLKSRCDFGIRCKQNKRQREKAKQKYAQHSMQDWCLSARLIWTRQQQQYHLLESTVFFFFFEYTQLFLKLISLLFMRQSKSICNTNICTQMEVTWMSSDDDDDVYMCMYQMTKNSKNARTRTFKTTTTSFWIKFYLLHISDIDISIFKTNSFIFHRYIQREICIQM